MFYICDVSCGTQKAQADLSTLMLLNFTSVRTEANLYKEHLEVILFFFLYTVPNLRGRRGFFSSSLASPLSLVETQCFHFKLAHLTMSLMAENA